jgi:hypothetical protein
MCEQPILSIVSSKMPSGVAAELERDLVAELGDAAMWRGIRSYAGRSCHDVENFPRLMTARAVRER